MSTQGQPVQYRVAVSGAFDDIRSRDIRFLQEASRYGEVTVWLWDDTTVERLAGQAPKFPLSERRYFLEAIRFVGRVRLLSAPATPDMLPSETEPHPDIWVDLEDTANPARLRYCETHGIRYQVLAADRLQGFPLLPVALESGRKKVVVTGCYDWFHSGHVRFFEEVSSHGDLYVIVGHDANIKLLKGAGHPLLSQEERCYVAGSIRYVTGSMVSSGQGWLDAEPEIERLKPDIYAVNDDGDKGGKREFCEQHGLEYLVLKRTPAPGLPKRSSTHLRGF